MAGMVRTICLSHESFPFPFTFQTDLVHVCQTTPHVLPNDTSVAARSGGGAAEAAGVADQVDVHIGTLSKAAGAHGGFVACRSDLRALLVTRGRPGVFSTALPAPVVAAASAALRVAAKAGALHERFSGNSALVVNQQSLGHAVHHEGGRRRYLVALSVCPVSNV